MKSYIDTSAQIKLAGNLKVGIPAIKGSKVRSRFVVGQNASLEVKHKCEFLEGCDVQLYRNGKLIADDMHANIDLEISCGHSIEFGSEVTIGRHVRIKDFNGHEVSYEGYPFSAPITIENHVWLCTGCTINPGVCVRTGAVVADNSNVISDVEAKSFNQGNPSQVIAKNIIFKI